MLGLHLALELTGRQKALGHPSILAAPTELALSCHCKP